MTPYLPAYIPSFAPHQVVLGASLFAANLSTSFRLRKFGMSDLAMYGVSLLEDEVHGSSSTATPSSSEVRNTVHGFLALLTIKDLIVAGCSVLHAAGMCAPH
jgi:hypothetical protein